MCDYKQIYYDKILSILVKRLPKDLIVKSLDIYYNDTNRLYHGIMHIYRMISYVIFYYEDKYISTELLVGILFHDIVYDPTKNNNEEQSVELFKEFISDYENIDIDKRKVERLILATKDHFKYIHDPEFDVRLIIKLDIIEPFENNRFMLLNNEKEIRYEYKHLSDEEYIEKRINFLEEIKDKFKYHSFIKQYNNCKRVISFLKSQRGLNPKDKDLNYYINNPI